MDGGRVVRVGEEGAGRRTSDTSNGMTVTSSLPPCLRLLKKWALQLVIIAVVVTAVVVPIVLVLRRETCEVPPNRIPCANSKCSLYA